MILLNGGSCDEGEDDECHLYYGMHASKLVCGPFEGPGMLRHAFGGSYAQESDCWKEQLGCVVEASVEKYIDGVSAGQ
jgi:hypothetical protein